MCPTPNQSVGFSGGYVTPTDWFFFGAIDWFLATHHHLALLFDAIHVLVDGVQQAGDELVAILLCPASELLRHLVDGPLNAMVQGWSWSGCALLVPHRHAQTLKRTHTSLAKVRCMEKAQQRLNRQKPSNGYPFGRFFPPLEQIQLSPPGSQDHTGKLPLFSFVHLGSPDTARATKERPSTGPSGAEGCCFGRTRSPGQGAA